MSVVKAVSVRVPATTSNLGPGYDCVGMALGLHNEVFAELHDEKGEPVVEISGEGEKSLPKDASNLIVKAARALGDYPGRLVFRCRNRIPTGRGLGSSAAAVVAGLFAGRALQGATLGDEDLLQYATALEGHPDNAAPAVLGGAVLSIKERDRFRFFPLTVHPETVAVVCVPDFELSTAKSRAAVPRTVLLENAVDNVGRAMLLSQALSEGRWEALACAMEDRLHQPYRAPLVPGLAAVLAAARQAGTCGSALSGAGPSVLALCRAGGKAPDRIGQAMSQAFADNGTKSRYVILTLELRGAQALAA